MNRSLIMRTLLVTAILAGSLSVVVAERLSVGAAAPRADSDVPPGRLSSPSRPAGLSLQARTWAVATVKKIYLEHRTMPPGAVDTVTPPDERTIVTAARRQVEKSLRMTAALKRIWHEELSGRQLQAELDRIARRTKRPEILRLIFESLDNDPVLLAESLARPILVERFLQRRYDSDRTIQAESLREFMLQLSREPGPSGNRPDPGGAVRRTLTLTRGASPFRVAGEDFRFDPTHLFVSAEEWSRLSSGGIEDLVTFLERKAAAPRTIRIIGEPEESSDFTRWRLRTNCSRMRESASGFACYHSPLREGHSIRIVQHSFPKEPFAAWWARVAESFDPEVPESPPPASMALPRIGGESSGMEDDIWRTYDLRPRSEHAAFWTGTEMIVFGGIAYDHSSSYDYADIVRTGMIYDPVRDSWRFMSPPPDELIGRDGLGSVWTGKELICWGGLISSGWQNSGAVYDYWTDGWRLMSTVNAPLGRIGHGRIWDGRRMLVWGGGRYSTDLYADGGCYDPGLDSWSPITTVGAPQARRNHLTSWTNTGTFEMFIWGGKSWSNVTLHNGKRYDSVNDCWLDMSTIGCPSSHDRSSIVSLGDRVIIWGGATATAPYTLNTGSIYDPRSDAWTSVTTVGAPVGRYRHAAAWTGSAMAVWGGYSPSGGGNNGGIYDPATDHWTLIPSADTVRSRQNHSMVWTGSEFIIFGGYGSSNGQVSLNDGLRISANGQVWRFLRTPLLNRSGHTGVWTGTHFLVWGGLVDTLPTNSGESFDPVAATYTPISFNGSPSPRTNHAAVWTGDEMIVWGGKNQQTRYNDGGIYDPLIDSWRTLSTVNAPWPRELAAAEWSGHEMLVWGGNDDDQQFNTGGRYDLRTNRWRPMSIIEAPPPTTKPVHAWNGREMFVWVGTQDCSAARYDPAANSWIKAATAGTPYSPGGAVVWTGTNFIRYGGWSVVYQADTDSWRTIATINRPLGSESETAVWTGTEMIVWGGTVASGTPASRWGGRYSPRTDAWLAMSTINCGTHLRDNVAAWTGEEMIIWGEGEASFYKPSTEPGEWSGLTTVDAPSRRYGHRAVATGLEMIVWGGWDGQETNTGGIFDLILDAWRPTPLAGAPAGRIFPTALWTGRDMIVWGGRWANGMDSSGGRFDPLADRWTPTPLNGAPSARWGHSAVFSGDEMIVWGGYSGFGFLNDGGRFRLAANEWRAMAPSLTNSPRMGHSAAWTGEDMLVWGGLRQEWGSRGTTVYPIDCLDYRPDIDTWIPMPPSNGIIGRVDHSTVWTGQDLVVWGGFNETELASGARFNLWEETWHEVSPIPYGQPRSNHSAVWTGLQMILFGGNTHLQPNEFLRPGYRYLPDSDRWLPLRGVASPALRHSHSAVWTGREMIVWAGIDPVGRLLNTGGVYVPGDESALVPSLRPAWLFGLLVIMGGLLRRRPARRSNHAIQP